MEDWVLGMRGVVVECPKCDGLGVRSYPDSSTWHRNSRGGGQTFTAGVCDGCWGSGDSDRPWPSWRKAEERERRRVVEMEQLRGELKRCRTLLADAAFTLRHEPKESFGGALASKIEQELDDDE